MFTKSHNITDSLKSKLSKIDRLYLDIMVIPVAPQVESRLRSQAIISHIEGWAALANQPLSKNQIVDILGRFQAKNESQQIAKVLNYKNAINYVRENWTANPAPVTFEVISKLAEILDVNKPTRQAVEPLLHYLETNQSHSIIQSGLAHLAFYPNRLAYLTSLLYLAKAGYDLRGWLSLEDSWSHNKDNYLEILQAASADQNPIIWLEYFCQAIIVQMTTIKSTLQSQSTLMSGITLKNLSSRQRAILDMFEESSNPITNRQVQEAFKVSQVTASRDLARLSIEGLLASHGGGRSTSYTKI